MRSTVLVALNKGLHTWVDFTDLVVMGGHLWHATPITFSRRSAHYAAGRIEGRAIGLHRHLLALRGRRVVADHINHDGLDNRRCNLRPATYSQNSANRSFGRDAPLSLGLLPPGVPIITREALKACGPDRLALAELVAAAPLSPARVA